ncbi:UDP-2,3-diacylglucosamine hydrolase [Planctomycetes bacterium Poly30]|uniref:UDP-2,3-diacylglucosamine hydrolase n=1 Tax=Saltatorellus ferox TaxID=2528018 RepID=A0A518EU08_9BACT|nr:UDP-2,3-diacylglucosamine hydrolase [Planctomycetes bacterium Poly30]
MSSGSKTDAEGDLPEGSIPTAEIELRPGALVIADLHLAPTGDARTAGFIEWCDGLGPGVPQLVIMGDFFDTWVGAKQVRLPGTKEVLDALLRATARGASVHVIPGNRDALMDASFERATGAELHAEGFIGVLSTTGGRAAFVHGDSLCTLDHDYLRLRPIWRKPFVRWMSRHAPFWFARWVGHRMRKQSENRKAYKPTEAKSIRPAAVHALARATRAELVVCGHAHDTRDERLEGGPRFVVVGAWGWPHDVFRVVPDGALVPHSRGD